MASAPGGNTVVVEGQDAQDDAADDSTDDAEADDQTDQADQADEVDQGGDEQQAGEEQQQQPEGQPSVKTPEQLLQELQQRQQQMQQGSDAQGVLPISARNARNVALTFSLALEKRALSPLRSLFRETHLMSPDERRALPDSAMVNHLFHLDRTPHSSC
jgi:hypothetical protein